MSQRQYQQYGREVQSTHSHGEADMSHYFELAGRIAAQFFHRLPSQIDREDVVQIATLALLELQQKYQQQQQPLNEGTVVLRVRGAIIDAMRNNDWVPRRAIANKTRIVKTFQQLSQQLLREPGAEEMANALDIPLAEYHLQEMELSQTSLFSLDELLTDMGGSPADTVQQLPESMLEQQQLSELIKSAILSLNEKQQIFVTLFYQELMSQKEIALILDCSEASVSRIHGRVLINLAAKMQSHTEHGH